MTTRDDRPEAAPWGTRARTNEAGGRLEETRLWVVVEDAIALLRLHELERLAWRRTLEHVAPDASSDSLRTADALVEQLRGHPRASVARLLLTNAELCARLLAEGEAWGNPAPWQVLTRIHRECLQAMLREPHIVCRYAWPHIDALHHVLRAYDVHVLVASSLTWPQLSLALEALRATELADDYLCSDDTDEAAPGSLGLAALSRLFRIRCRAAVLVQVASTRNHEACACVSLIAPVRARGAPSSAIVPITELPTSLDRALQHAATPRSA